jgi:alkylated DNA repair dioxygenase AlkB
VTERLHLPAGGFIDSTERFLAPEAATALHAKLVDCLEWQERAIVLFGRSIVQPRLIAWCGDIAYRYSGQTLEPRPWMPQLEDLRRRIEEHAAARFNHVLVNRYRNGADSMGMHSDDEPELGENPVVASVSLGVTRRFVLKPRRGRHAAITMPLTHGLLLVMGGSCQHHYRHGVPKEPSVTEERINLTFRLLLREPDSGGS